MPKNWFESLLMVGRINQEKPFSEEPSLFVNIPFILRKANGEKWFLMACEKILAFWQSIFVEYLVPAQLRIYPPAAPKRFEFDNPI